MPHMHAQLTRTTHVCATRVLHTYASHARTYALTVRREHANRIIFSPDQSALDPQLDLVLASGELRATLQVWGSVGASVQRVWRKCGGSEDAGLGGETCGQHRVAGLWRSCAFTLDLTYPQFQDRSLNWQDVVVLGRTL